MNNVLEKVKALRSSGKANLKDAELEKDVELSSELLEDALSDFENARKLLIDELNDYYSQGNTTFNSVEREYFKKVAFELADLFGMTGGILRRKGRYGKALQMYHKGKVIEDKPEFELQSSYNTVNSIVLSILNDPDNFKKVAEGLNPTLNKVQKIVEGPGRGNWWSWADYALLLLMSGDEKGAFNAYNNFSNAGALNTNYQSTINVLVELRDILKNVNHHVSSLIASAVEFLQAEKAAL